MLNPKFSCAFIRGHLADKLDKPLLDKPLEQLSDQECAAIQAVGRANGLSLHKFKQKDSLLPRVAKVMGLLQGLTFETLLDVGTGRGAFLWPFMEAFPWIHVTCLDILPHRVADLEAVRRGGISTLRVQQGSIEEAPFQPGAFDVVTLLEVLEHIPNCDTALAHACRIAQTALLVSVPSKPDDNPEHIHLFTKERLTAMFAANGIHKVRFHSVPNHLIVLALKQP